MKLEEFKQKHSGLINKIKDNPELILDLSYKTMVTFIIIVGKIKERDLFITLKDIAYSKYGELVIADLITELNVPALQDK